MKILNINSLETTSISIDKLGRIYFYKNRVLRVINDNYISLVKEMFNSGFLSEIIDKKLFVDTWIPKDLQTEGYNLVVEHKKIENWNYPYEWTFSMLKDAAKTMIEINKIAKKYGFVLKDTHSNNIVFQNNKPLYFDLGGFDFLDKNDKNMGYRGIYSFFYIPLFLFSKKYLDIARNILLMRKSFSEREFFMLKYPFISKVIPFKFLFYLKKLALARDEQIKNRVKNRYFFLFLRMIKRMLRLKFSIEILEKDINKLNFNYGLTKWGKYHNNINVENSYRFKRILDIINSLNDAQSLIEVGSNQGKFAIYISKHSDVKKIIATDYDEEAVDRMYLSTKELNISNIQSLVFDFVRPFGRLYDKPFYERVKSDIVLALALTHHLILSEGMDIQDILKRMKLLTKKYIIIEFMPLGLWDGSNQPKIPKYYTIDWFRKNFERFFQILLEEKLEKNRYLFVGKIK